MNTFKRFIYSNIIPIIGYIFKGRNKYVNIIYYHDIVRDTGMFFQKTNIDKFKEQMEYLFSSGYVTTSFEDLDDSYSFEKNKILIAFDDGWKSNYEILEYMKSKGLKYNVFLYIGKIGKDPDYLTWEQVREMYSSGLVGFGIHTYNHFDLSDITKIDTSLEFEESDRIFERELGFLPKDFCYPFGYYSEESNEYIISNCRYERIYTSRNIYAYKQGGKLIFGRAGISNDDTLKIFKSKSKGYYNIMSHICND